MAELVNDLGVTEAEWNRWRADVEAWEAVNPVRHEPWQDCHCKGFPQLSTLGKAGHCAVREPISDWHPSNRR